jgi:hypothetical protein
MKLLENLYKIIKNMSLFIVFIMSILFALYLAYISLPSVWQEVVNKAMMQIVF